MAQKQTPESVVKDRALAMTPLSLYLERVSAIVDSARASNKGVDYYPMQFGGITGQRALLSNRAVITVVDFQVENG